MPTISDDANTVTGTVEGNANEFLYFRSAVLPTLSAFMSLLCLIDCALACNRQQRHQEKWKTTYNRWTVVRKATDMNRRTPPVIRVPSSSTLDTVRSWAISFDKLMQSETGRQMFTKFLESEYSTGAIISRADYNACNDPRQEMISLTNKPVDHEENMLFWNACEDLKKRSSTKCINDIYETFISLGAPLEINLDSKTRNELRQRMAEHPDWKALEPAQEAVYLLMKRDSYCRFLKSKIYLDFMKRLERNSPCLILSGHQKVQL